MKLKIRNWIIFKEIGTNTIPYIFKHPENVSEDEISFCIQEQIYGGEDDRQ